MLAIRNNGARHARKCKAGIAVGYGFIFAVDFSRLFAREVENGDQNAANFDNEYSVTEVLYLRLGPNSEEI